MLEDAQVLGGKLVLTLPRTTRFRSSSRSRDLEGKPRTHGEAPRDRLGLPVGITGNPEDDVAYYAFTSYTAPHTVYETSVTKGGNTTYFELDVPVDPTPYTSEQVWYQSKDGTPISMFIIRRKDLKRDGSTPMLLTGYGGFNLTETPYFSTEFMVFLEHGGAVAVPNLRGGGEYGEAWHRAGMKEKKQNVFDDFIAASEYLIEEGYTSADKLAIRGGSNGGLLVGAAMVQRPELYKAVICAVPLLDMVRYHLFGSGKTWISEYGSAEKESEFKALHAYSPYHHVTPNTAYPSLLMLTADSDDRVDPMHARKFTAAIRHATTTPDNVYLRLEVNAGHGGGDLVKKTVKKRLDVFSFLFAELGMKP